MKTVKLITCDDAFQAHIIQGALANEGIDSLLHNENMSTLLRGFVHDISGVDVLVADCDYEAAMQLLRQNQMIPEEHHCGKAFEKPVTEFNPSALEEKD